MPLAQGNPDKHTDVQSYVLRLLRFKASVFFHSSYCGEWQFTTSGSGRSSFHVVSEGDCWLHMPILDQPVRLTTGDLVVFPHDAQYVICDSEVLPTGTIEQKILDENSKATALICGYFEFDSPKPNPVIQALPEWLLIPSEKGDVNNWLGKVIDIMRLETGSDIPGFEAVIDKLSEVLFIYVVRHYLTTNNPETGILAALVDIRIGNALRAFHQRPGANWTVERLAGSANMSRATFAALFTEILDQTPMQYVTHWRMQLAYAELLESRSSIAEIAEMVGYSSEAAFRKVFKQVMEITPGKVQSISSPAKP